MVFWHALVLSDLSSKRLTNPLVKELLMDFNAVLVVDQVNKFQLYSAWCAEEVHLNSFPLAYNYSSCIWMTHLYLILLETRERPTLASYWTIMVILFLHLSHSWFFSFLFLFPLYPFLPRHNWNALNLVPFYIGK